jgi:hypothetical protein
MGRRVGFGRFPGRTLQLARHSPAEGFGGPGGNRAERSGTPRVQARPGGARVGFGAPGGRAGTYRWSVGPPVRWNGATVARPRANLRPERDRGRGPMSNNRFEPVGRACGPVPRITCAVSAPRPGGWVAPAGLLPVAATTVVRA